MRMSGAQALVKSLQAEGVEVVFGYPGGVALPIFDALYEVESPRTILVRHEQAGVAGGRQRDERPRRDQHRHRHRERLHGLDPDGRLHGAGGDARHRH
jgi:hypothetical protein